MWSAAYQKNFFSVKIRAVDVSIFVFHAVIDCGELIFLYTSNTKNCTKIQKNLKSLLGLYMGPGYVIWWKKGVKKFRWAVPLIHFILNIVTFWFKTIKTTTRFIFDFQIIQM
jgi:hypothetical protein